MACPATPATAKFAIFGECLAGHLSDTALCSIDYVSVRPIRGAIHGPRCSGNVKVEAIPLADALAAIRTQLWPILDTEGVDIASARGRVLATDLVAKVNLPHWDSAAVDGFAVRGPDLVPDRINRLTVIGEAAAGHPFAGDLGPGQAVGTLTGAPLPVGAGAIAAGTRLRAQDVALAGALGCSRLQVRRQLSGLEPNCGMICSPDEATVHKFQMEGRQKCKDSAATSEQPLPGWPMAPICVPNLTIRVNLREHGSGGPRKIALIEEAATMGVCGRFAGSPGFLAAKPLARIES